MSLSSRYSFFHMFKKSITKGKQNLLNKKDSRGILLKLLPALSDISGADCALIECSCDYSDKACVYLSKAGEEIMGVRINRDEYFPSLCAIWEFRPVMPSIVVRGDVPHYILGGAHLMLPGIMRAPLNSLPFKVGDLVLLKAPRNEFAFAIGKALMSSSEISESPQTAKGKALEVLHFFGDGLWQLGSRAIPSGFSFDRIEASTSDIVDIAPAPVIVEESESADISLNESEYDELVLASFLCAAKCAEEGSLPMNASSLYSRMQAACRKITRSSSALKAIGGEVAKLRTISMEDRSKFKLELKSSSFKQLRNLLQTLQDRNWISFKQIRGEFVIVKISFENPAIKGFNVPSAEIATDADSLAAPTLVEVAMWFGLNAQWKNIFSEVVRSELTQGSKKDLSDQLRVYLCTIKGGSVSLPGFEGMEKKQLMKRFEDDLISFHSFSTELPPRVRKGNPPPVKISVKRIQGNKYCTVIKGLSAYFVAESEIASLLSNRLSVSASVTAEGLYCQGQLAGKVEQFLVNTVGVPKSSISS